MPEQSDQELAKLLMARNRQLDDAMVEIGELRNSLKANRLGITEWQGKYEHLLYKIHHPQEAQPPGQKKLLGFQVRAAGALLVKPEGFGPDDVLDLLSAVDVLLEFQSVRKDWILAPVFEGEVEFPNYVDRADLEDGDV